MYTINKNGITGEDYGVIRESDGAFIPPNLDNSDYKEYLIWLEEQNG